MTRKRYTPEQIIAIPDKREGLGRSFITNEDVADLGARCYVAKVFLVMLGATLEFKTSQTHFHIYFDVTSVARIYPYLRR